MIRTYSCKRLLTGGLFLILLLAGCRNEGELSGAAASSAVPSSPHTVASQSAAFNEGGLPASSSAASSDGNVLSVPIAVEKAKSIAAGNITDWAGYGWKPGVSLAVLKDGSALAWGYAQSGDREQPVAIKADRPIAQLSGSYLLTDDGQVQRLGAGGKALSIAELTDVMSIQELDPVFGTLFVLRKDGTVWRLARETERPERYGSETSIVAIYATPSSLFLQDRAGRLLYISGLKGSLDEASAAKEIFPKGVQSIAANAEDSALIRLNSGEAYMFDPHTEAVKREPRADGAVGMAVLSGPLTVFSRGDGTVWGYGKNTNGILGTDLEQADQPVQIKGLRNITDVKAGSDHVLALDGDGAIYSWGSNMTGQLGRMSVVFRQWEELGAVELSSLPVMGQQPSFIRDGGALWVMGPDRVLTQVKGVEGIKELGELYWYPVSLQMNGEIRIWSDDFSAYSTLPLSFKVKSMSVMGGRLLLLDEGGRFQTLQLDFPVVREAAAGSYYWDSVKVKPEQVIAEGGWSSRVVSLHANPYSFLALTEDGKVFYTDRDKAGQYTFKAIRGLPAIQSLAAEYYYLYSGEVMPLWALDQEGKTYEIRMDATWDETGFHTIKVEAEALDEENVALIEGNLRVTRDGLAYEYGKGEANLRARLPSPVRSVSVHYNYGIEGPGWHTYLFVTEDGRTGILGHNIFGFESAEPLPVRLGQ